MRRNEKKMKDKLDDEIKLACLESLVPEELEKHLIFNSNRSRTFEDASLGFVTYVEAKFGSRIRDSNPSDTGARGHSDPLSVDGVNSLSPGHFQRDCSASKSEGKQPSGKSKKSKSWSKGDSF